MDDTPTLRLAGVGTATRRTPATPAPPPAPAVNTASLTRSPPPAPAATAPARRRFKAADVAINLDMGMIGEVCVGVSLTGYRSVLGGFLADSSGNQAGLLAALERADGAALGALAHAVKGASASLGLRSLHQLSARIEAEGAAWSAAQCGTAAAQLRDTLETTRALLQRMGFA
jgi:HPt (histidine-containing phosphotransfer) domain-containing protein